MKWLAFIIVIIILSGCISSSAVRMAFVFNESTEIDCKETCITYCTRPCSEAGPVQYCPPVKYRTTWREEVCLCECL